MNAVAGCLKGAGISAGLFVGEKLMTALTQEEHT
jgi:hypothetical protein